MRRILAWLLSALLSLALVLLLAVGWLGFTTSGAVWLAEQAVAAEPRLQLRVSGGTLAHGLQIRDLSWQDQGVNARVAQGELAWSLGCLLRRQVCLDLVRLAQVEVELSESDQPAADAPARLELPLPLRVELLQVRDFQARAPGLVTRLGSLQASGGFADATLTLAWARLEGLQVALEPDPASAPVEEASAETAPAPLPVVELPLDLVLDGVLAEDIRIGTPEQDLALASVAVSADLKGSQLKLRKLQVVLAQAELEVQGQATLAGAWPLTVDLAGRYRGEALPTPLELTGKVAGDLERLSLQAQLEGAVVVSATGQLEPLNPRLPFKLSAQWEALSWPLDQAEPRLRLRDGMFNAGGSLDGYEFRLLSSLGGRDIPEGRWRLGGRGDAQGLEIQELTGDVLSGKLQASGRLDWRQGLDWQARVQVRDIDPGLVLKDYPGRLSGRLQGQGRVVDGRYSLDVSSEGVEGRLRGYPVAAQGRVRKDLAGTLRFEKLRLSSGPNQVLADGRLDKALSLSGRFDLPRINALLPQLEGAAEGRFEISGPPETPSVELSLTSRSLALEGVSLSGLALDARIQRLGLGDSHVRWRARELALQGQSLGEIDGSLEGTRSQHEASLRAAGGRYGGELDIAGSLDPKLNWRGRLTSARLSLPPRQQWQLLEAAELEWRQAARTLSVQPHCWGQDQARLCASQPLRLGAQGEVAARVRGFQLEWLAPALPEDVRWRGGLDGELSARWQPDQPIHLEAGVTTRDGRLILRQEEAGPLVLAYRELAADLRLGSESARLVLRLDSESLGAGSLEVATAGRARPMPLSGKVALRGLRLEVLKPFLPQIQVLEGQMRAEGRLAGTLEDPAFHGVIALEGGSVAATGLPMTLSDIGLNAQVDGAQARLQGSFASGDGQGRLQGQAGWSGHDWQVELGVSGDNLAFEYAPVARLRVSPQLTLRVRPQLVEVTGKVTVPRGQITLQALPEGAVEVSEDVVVVRGRQAQEEATAPGPQWAVVTDIELILGDRVELSGQGLSGRLGGALRLRQRAGGAPEAVGEVRIVGGRYRAYGQDLTIRRGQLLFAGPVQEPALNVEAVRVVNNVVAGIRVEGRPRAPQVSLFSEPSMSSEDVLSYILRGRPMHEGGGGGQEDLAAQAALALGAFGGRGLATGLAEELGIEDFELGATGQGEDTQFALSGYLTPDLFVQYGIGVFTPVNTLTVRYRLAPSFYVEGVSGLQNALDFFYEFRF